MPFEITRPISQLKSEAKQRINDKAGQVILARLPIWKQTNYTARAVELQSMGQNNWTANESAEWSAMTAQWDWVKSIRAASNFTASRIDASTTAADIYQHEKDFNDSVALL